MNDEAKFTSWPCPHGCIGGNGKAWHNKGFRTKCQKCDKGPRPGQRTKIQGEEVNGYDNGYDKGKGKGGKGKGKGKEGKGGNGGNQDFGKQIALLVSSFSDMSKAMLDLKNGNINTKASDPTPEDGYDKPDVALLEKMAMALKKDQEALKEATSNEDIELATIYEGRVDRKKQEIQKLKNENTTPAEQTYNLSGEALKELQSTRSKASKLGKQFKKAKEEAEELRVQKLELEKTMEDKAQKAIELQKEYDSTNARLESISKAAKGDATNEPMALDIFAVLSNVERLHTCAVEQLPADKAEWLKKIVDDLGKFTTALPAFLPQNLPADAANDAMDDVFVDDELTQATKAANEAVDNSAAGADKESVRCQAYYSKLSAIKKSRIAIKKGITKPSRG